MQLEAIKAEGSPDNLAKRTAARLIEKSELVLRRASAAIRLDRFHDLAAVFDRDGHISLGTLWAYYTTYPYLPACAIAKSSKTGSCPHLDTPIDWQNSDSPQPTAGTDRSTLDWSCPPTPLTSSGPRSTAFF